MYPDYYVPKIESFKDLIKLMDSEYHSSIAFSYVDKDLTFGELVEQILKVCAGLTKIPQSKVQIFVQDSFNFASLYLATVAIGKVAILGGEPSPPLDDVIVMTDGSFSAYVSAVPCSIDDLPTPNTTNLCTILFSSGTSSTPKGVMLSQRNLCSNAVCSLEKYHVMPGDKIINLIPYSHAFGIVCDLLCPLLQGVTTAVLENKSLFFAELPRIKPTLLNVPPIIIETLLRIIKNTGNADAVTGGRLKKILCGGAGLKASVSKELRDYGIFTYGCYGLTECSPGVAINRDNYYKDGSAGIPFGCTRVSIADDGEILVSGANVMLGYYNDPVATEKAIVNGVLHTGDLGYIDEDGFLFITGRKSNMIVFSDGTKCCPEALEDQIVINTPANEALVYKSANEQRSTLQAKVYISNESQIEEIKEYINKNLTDHRFDSIEFTLEPLPKNANGKIRRI